MSKSCANCAYMSQVPTPYCTWATTQGATLRLPFWLRDYEPTLYHKIWDRGVKCEAHRPRGHAGSEEVIREAQRQTAHLKNLENLQRLVELNKLAARDDYYTKALEEELANPDNPETGV